MLFAPLRPRVPRGLRALTAPAHRSSIGHYVLAGRLVFTKSTDRALTGSWHGVILLVSHRCRWHLLRDCTSDAERCRSAPQGTIDSDPAKSGVLDRGVPPDPTTSSRTRLPKGTLRSRLIEAFTAWFSIVRTARRTG